MISIIVSSRSNENYRKVEVNLSSIGVQYELLYYVNDNRKSLTYVYNTLVKKAKFDLICIMHDDLEIRSKNWGRILINNVMFQDKLIGLAGSKLFTGLPIGWTTGLENMDFCFVNHPNENNPMRPNLCEAVMVIDGVFMFSTRRIFNEVPFSENINGFHFYDIDFSFRVSKIFPVNVISSIDCIHESKGNFNSEWAKLAIKFSKNYFYEKSLLSKSSISKIRNFWFLRLRKEKININTRFKYLLHLGIDINSVLNGVKFLLNYR